MEYGIRILVLLLSQHFRYAHFIVYSYLRIYAVKLKNSMFQKNSLTLV